MAIQEGKLALHWTPLKFTLETDCAEVLELIKVGTPNTSAYAFRISAIRELLKERETLVVSHELARIVRVQGQTEVWLRNFPPEIEAATALDCNSTLI